MQKISKKHMASDVRYIIESSNGFLWEEYDVFGNYEEAKEQLDKHKQTHPNGRFRLIRSVWEVVAM